MSDSAPTASIPASRPVSSFMLSLALPVLVEEFLNLTVGYTDWWLTGHYLPGLPPKAAMGLIAYALWLIPSLFSAIAIGATAMTARFTGSVERDSAVAVVNQSLLLGGLLAVLATFLTLGLGDTFVAAMRLEGEARQLVVRYLWILSPAIPFIMIEQVAVACLHGAGDTTSGCIAKAIVNFVNIAVSSSLVIGIGPIPQLGWDGLAIGTATGHTVGGCLLLAMLWRGRSGLKISAAIWRPDVSLLRRLLRVGLPGGFDVLLILFCHLVYVAIINRLGAAATAAHGLGVQIEALSYLPGAAFQVAASTIAGQYLGAGKPREATRGVLTTLAAGAAVMSLAALAFFFGGHLLAAFFTGDPNEPTTRETARLLKIVAIATPFLAVLMILNGALRGAGDTRVPLLITLVGFFGIRLPGACWLAWEQIPLPFTDTTLPGWNWGVEGAWMAMVADVIVRSLLVVWRFARGNWQQVAV